MALSSLSGNLKLGDKQEPEVHTKTVIKICGYHNIWHLRETINSLNVSFNKYLDREWEMVEAGVCRGAPERFNGEGLGQ